MGTTGHPGAEHPVRPGTDEQRAISGHDNKEQAITEKQIYIRVATGHGREKLRGMFARSSPQTIYKRFHIPYPDVP
jgi:hypothetical protein